MNLQINIVNFYIFCLFYKIKYLMKLQNYTIIIHNYKIMFIYFFLWLIFLCFKLIYFDTLNFFFYFYNVQYQVVLLIYKYFKSIISIFLYYQFLITIILFNFIIIYFFVFFFYCLWNRLNFPQIYYIIIFTLKLIMVIYF
jgi:hypothetical protein